MTTTVHGVSGSPFVRKVLLTLELKGVEYTLDPMLPVDKNPEFIAKSPLGKIPYLEDEEITLADSSVICQYLEERYPTPAILPADRAKRARARFLEEYSDTRGVEVFGAKLFYERMLKPRFFNQATDETVVAENLANGIPPVNTYLEGQAPASGFLLGQDIGLADFAIGSQLINAMLANYRVDAARWPKLAAWFERFLAHPTVAKRLKQESVELAGLFD